MDRLKVLYKDMNEEDKRRIENKLRRINKIKGFYGHAEKRIKERGITKEEIRMVLNDYEIIEVNYGFSAPPRVLIRSKKPSHNNYCTCVVLRFDGKVITAYRNHYKDVHKTLRLDGYLNPSVRISI